MPASARELSERCPEVSGARRVPLANQHVTLLFAGSLDVADARRLHALTERLDRRPLSVSVQRLGGFPAAGRARVLAAELEPSPALAGWHGQLLAGWPQAQEGRAFRPHVTVLRSRRALRMPELSADALQLSLESPALYESLSLPEGALYRALAY